MILSGMHAAYLLVQYCDNKPGSFNLVSFCWQSFEQIQLKSLSHEIKMVSHHNLNHNPDIVGVSLNGGSFPPNHPSIKK